MSSSFKGKGLRGGGNNKSKNGTGGDNTESGTDNTPLIIAGCAVVVAAIGYFAFSSSSKSKSSSSIQTTKSSSKKKKQGSKYDQKSFVFISKQLRLIIFQKNKSAKSMIIRIQFDHHYSKDSHRDRQHKLLENELSTTKN